jgi:hypothetical protein
MQATLAAEMAVQLARWVELDAEDAEWIAGDD